MQKEEVQKGLEVEELKLMEVMMQQVFGENEESKRQEDAEEEAQRFGLKRQEELARLKRQELKVVKKVKFKNEEGCMSELVHWLSDVHWEKSVCNGRTDGCVNNKELLMAFYDRVRAVPLSLQGHQRYKLKTEHIASLEDKLSAWHTWQ